MKLEEQITSWIISRKLKELGVQQDSLFWWAKPGRKKQTRDCSAFTVAKLGKMLPNYLVIDNEGRFLRCEKSNDFWGIGYTMLRKDGSGGFRNGLYGYRNEKTEANTRGLMLIWLIENGHLKANKI